MRNGSRLSLVVVGPSYPYRGGIAHFTDRLVTGLRGRGHRVDVVTFKRQYPSLLFPGESQFEPGSETAPTDASRLIDTLNPLTWIRTARRIARLKPDAVLFGYWMPFMAPAFGVMARLVRRAGIPVLVLAHNVLPHERHRGDLWLNRFFLKAGGGFVVMSDTVRRDLTRVGVQGPVERVAHPVYDTFGPAMDRDGARRRLDLPPDARVLLFFGLIRKYKGLHVLLHAMPAILARLPDVHLVVAGEFYDDAEAYRDQIQSLEIGSRVHIHAGYVPNEEVAVFFSAADLVVQPYLSATQSGVAQIAFHYDRPVVVTDVGGLGESVPDGRAGFVTPPNDPDALAAAILQFFENDLAAPFTAGVQEEKKKFSWDRVYEAVERLADPPSPDNRSRPHAV